ncbi:DNA polymerase-3 subunit delta' [Thermosyntropha lipolytica DSM 11003]|uniref:DNA polymerase-3 subunit delta n=1 Tax=Thermosyntropha lipolytica DSM 11003 TaxID=1123382 RepID=A0A1M5JMU0_9FIRM|nr:DNA polymerase III subunit delta' [Thermosyntropha lipolytica]SHG41705.1 DNA polymerase-3 subunit delta' [Thermosyntropha lipolytica DSM 11003]
MPFLAQVKGQDKALHILKKAAEGGNISHAYLFIGPEGVGKMLTARMWAYSLLSREDENAALYLREGMHPDLLVIERDENKTLLGKDKIVKDLEPWLALKPYHAGHRIAIIRDAHLLSMEGANALLKTLEEPPSYAVIILIADENTLLETIVSRCQVIRFSPLPSRVLEEILLTRGISEEKAKEAARLGQGSVAYALHFGEEEISKNWQTALYIVSILGRDGEAAIGEAAEKMEANPQLIIRMLETILRDMLVYNSTGEELLLTVKESQDIVKMLNKRLNEEKLRQAINKIGVLKGYYRRNVNSLLININVCYAVKNALF